MTYLSLNEYGIIGNQTSAALVSRYGSIDWCCFPYLDSPSHFAALLDESHGGSFGIHPVGDYRSEQRYLQRTFVLETWFETPHGRAILTDWMEIEGEGAGKPLIHRRIEVVDGKILWLLLCRPSFNYGEAPALAEYHRNGVIFREESHSDRPGQFTLLEAHIPLEIPEDRRSALARFQLESGESAVFSWSWGRTLHASMHPKGHLPRPSLHATASAWRLWAHRCTNSSCIFAGPWHDLVSRSGLCVKLLSHPQLGSIAESITPPLPDPESNERLGDYRYAWLRNSAFYLQALVYLGYKAEADSFMSWLSEIVLRDGPSQLKSLYALDGGKPGQERELPSLAGYPNSKPVRVGNEAANFFELDVYGHVLMAFAEYHKLFGTLAPGEGQAASLWPVLAEIADFISHAWRRPDHGPWETRGPSQHFTGSKLMCWVALDRAAWLSRMTGLEGSPRWLEERDILHQMICQQGYDDKVKSFIRAFGDPQIDSSALLIPLVRFLPMQDPRIQNTLKSVQERLGEGAFLRRWEGDELHLPSSFQMVSCLALDGKADEASNRLAELCTYATPLGFFGEQMNLPTDRTSGNFPSTSAHFALINAALYVGMARGRALLHHHLIGMPDALRVGRFPKGFGRRRERRVG